MQNFPSTTSLTKSDEIKTNSKAAPDQTRTSTTTKQGDTKRPADNTDHTTVSTSFCGCKNNKCDAFFDKLLNYLEKQSDIIAKCCAQSLEFKRNSDKLTSSLEIKQKHPTPCKDDPKHSLSTETQKSLRGKTKSKDFDGEAKLENKHQRGKTKNKDRDCNNETEDEIKLERRKTRSKERDYSNEREDEIKLQRRKTRSKDRDCINETEDETKHQRKKARSKDSDCDNETEDGVKQQIGKRRNKYRDCNDETEDDIKPSRYKSKHDLENNPWKSEDKPCNIYVEVCSCQKGRKSPQPSRRSSRTIDDSDRISYNQRLATPPQRHVSPKHSGYVIECQGYEQKVSCFLKLADEICEGYMRQCQEQEDPKRTKSHFSGKRRTSREDFAVQVPSKPYQVLHQAQQWNEEFCCAPERLVDTKSYARPIAIEIDCEGRKEEIIVEPCQCPSRGPDHGMSHPSRDPKMTCLDVFEKRYGKTLRELEAKLLDPTNSKPTPGYPNPYGDCVPQQPQTQQPPPAQLVAPTLQPSPAQPEAPTQQPPPAQPEAPPQQPPPAQPEAPTQQPAPAQPEPPIQQPPPAQPEAPTQQPPLAQPEAPTQQPPPTTSKKRAESPEVIRKRETSEDSSQDRKKKKKDKKKKKKKSSES